MRSAITNRLTSIFVRNSTESLELTSPTCRASASYSAYNPLRGKTDFSRFRNASAFASWLGLCPEKQISGGKFSTPEHARYGIR